MTEKLNKEAKKDEKKEKVTNKRKYGRIIK